MSLICIIHKLSFNVVYCMYADTYLHICYGEEKKAACSNEESEDNMKEIALG